MKSIWQSSLEDFTNEEIEESIEENIEEGVEESVNTVRDRGVENVLDDLYDPEGKSKCEYCRRVKFRLHPGAMYLYFKNGGLKVLADMDHVYGRCRKGLEENIVFLYGMFNELKGRGYKVLTTGKAFDDDLYVYVYGSSKEDEIDYDGFHILVINGFSNIREFERLNNYMDSVDEEAILEVLKRG